MRGISDVLKRVCCARLMLNKCKVLTVQLQSLKQLSHTVISKAKTINQRLENMLIASSEATLFHQDYTTAITLSTDAA